MLAGKTIIVGARGFLGKSLIKIYAQTGKDHSAPTRNELDLLNPASCVRFSKQIAPEDRIIFGAAIHANRSDIQDSFADNIQMVDNFCRSIKERPPAQITYASSVAVYAPFPTLISEASPASPMDLYGCMHLVREHLFRSYFDGRLLITRITSLFGPDNIALPYGPDKFLKEIRKTNQITLWGNGMEKRDHLSVWDAARFLYEVSQNKQTGILNLVCGNSVSFRRIAEQVTTTYGSKSHIQHLPQNESHPHRHFDPSLLMKSVASFKPYSVLDYVKEAFG